MGGGTEAQFTQTSPSRGVLPEVLPYIFLKFEPHSYIQNSGVRLSDSSLDSYENVHHVQLLFKIAYRVAGGTVS